MTQSDEDRAGEAALARAEALAQYDAVGARTALVGWLAASGHAPARIGRAAAVALGLRDAALALEVARRFVDAAPEFPGSHHALALARRLGGDREGALAALDAALVLAPRAGVLHVDRGSLLLELERSDEAVCAFGACLAASPDDRNARAGRGVALLRSMKFEQALPDLAWWVAAEPRNADAWRAYGEALELTGRSTGEAAAARLCELDLDPSAARRRDVGLAMSRLGLNDRARALLADAAADPKDIVARWIVWQSLPLVYRDEAEIASWRATWCEGLGAMESLELQPFSRSDLESAICAATPFVLHYHLGDPAPLQRRYGAVLSRLARATAGDARPRATPRSTGKLRIGFASAYFFGHTVRGLFHQWLARLDRARFEVVAIHLSSVDDDYTRTLPELADHAVRGAREPAEWVRAISAADLDALVWLDIGMHGLTQLLASVRLAPVTAMAWGHPITSGFDAVDAFLTGDAMEPEGGEAHYTERLVRLPKLGIRFPYPLPRDAPTRSARDPARAPRLVCVQSVFKMHPRNLALFARIARRLPRAELHFVPHPSPEVRAQFEALLRERFEAQGARFGCVRIHPGLAHDAFLALLASSDVFLDTIGWSGGHTTLEALATDLPVVTWPGAYMRQRHTFGMLKLMGLEAELAVTDEASYIDKVAQLAEDLEYHERILAEIRARKAVLYDDDEPVRALERWLLEACGRTAD